MKYLTIIFLLALSSCAFSQADFSAYDNITDPNFQAYVDLFPEQSLPVSSESLRGSDLIKLSVQDIPDAMIDDHLKINNNYIAPVLYTLEVETGQTTDEYGYFQPVFKLPTNGNYVLLVVYQVDVRSEWMYRALVLSYNLAGNFIKAVGPGYLIDGAAPYVSTSINAQLEFSHTYITNASTNRSDFFQCKPCDKPYKTDTYQILGNGQDNLLSTTDHGIGSFRYNGYYFKAVE